MSKRISLPASPHLDHLRKQAKDLLSAHRRGDLDACQRIAENLPRLSATLPEEAPEKQVTLQEVHHVIAQEYGYLNWAVLAKHVIAMGGTLNLRPIEKNYRSAIPVTVGWIGQDGGNDPCGGGEHKHGGTTAGGRHVAVPECRTWYVEPQTREGHANWADVLNEVAQEGIPGIATGPNVDDQTLAEIGKLNHLTYLDLSLAKDITDVGLQHLRGLDQLQAIYLSRCKQITDKGLQVLTSFPMLKVVRLTNLPLITDEGLSSLSDHENLQLVTMTLSNTGDDALQVLRNKPSLTHLSPGNKTTDEGLALLKSFPGLANWSDGRPKHLIDEYRSPSPSCLNLDLREGMPITNDGLKQLEELDGVYEMGIPVQHVESKISGAGAEHIAKMRNVQVLWWASEVCDDESLTHLGNMINLESLVCFGSSATDRGYEALSKCESLTSVYASGKISSQTLESLSKLPSLRYLNVDGKHMKDGDLEPLSRFPALNNLWAWRFGNEGYRYIGRVEGLEELVNMYCNDTDDAATEYLAGLSNLHKYNIWTTQITDKSLDVLSGMDSLQQILLQKCNRLTDEGLAKLQRLPLLRSLSLQQCQGLTEKGIGVFGVDVQVNFQPA